MKRILIFLFILLFFLFSRTSYAATIFEDNFNQYADGVFPAKWRLFHLSGQAAQCTNASVKVESGILKLKVNQSGCTYDLVPAIAEWPQMKDSYVFESDVTLISGSDRHFSYRFSPVAPELIRTIHIFPSGEFTVETDNPNYNTYVPMILQFNHAYHFRMEVRNDGIKVYVGEPGGEPQLVRDNEFITHIWAGTIGLGESPGSGSNTETWFDNVKVTTLENQNNSDLAVPLLKQTDSLWGSNLYDNANLWSTGATDMSRWGCAVTSAAMVLRYNKVDRLPSNELLDPGTLNTWLKSVSDGYIRNGLVNWMAISRLTKLAKDYNPDFNFDALEYKRVSGQHDDLLKSDIENNIPGILSEPGHFVVAKGVSGNTFNINDPFYSRTTLNDYGNSYSSYGKFIPSNTDLAYLMFVVDPNVNISLKDSQGNVMGEVFTELPLADPLNTLTNTTGPLKVLIFAKPPTDNYKVEVTSSTAAPYFLQGYLYDVNGNVKMFEKKDVVSQDNADTYNINFDKDNSSNGDVMQDVTLLSFKNDLITLYSLGHIKKETYKELLEKIKEIEKNQNKKGEGGAHKLRELNKEIGKKKGVDSYAADILLNDLQQLIASISPSSHGED